MTPLLNWIRSHPVGAIFIVLAAGIMAGTAWLFVMLDNPHMKDQPSMQAYERYLPPLPEGVVVQPEPAEAVSYSGAGPRERSPQAIRRGQTYYGYYCAFCHGERGDGEGPVGKSYLPKPADLRKQTVQAREDSVLARLMVSGVGHKPVLERIVPVEYRSYIVLYIRQLGGDSRMERK
jgi:hypothetical protein